MKKYFYVLSIGFILHASFAQADKITLKNGREIEGKIVEETDECVKINIGVGTVGFNRDRIQEVQKSDGAEAKKLEEKLEEKRKESLKLSEENENLYDRDEKRSELIQNQRARQDELNVQREEMLRKRREQLEALRSQREEALKQRASQEPGSAVPVPPAPPIPNETEQPSNTSQEVRNTNPAQPSQPQPQDLNNNQQQEDTSRQSNSPFNRSPRGFHRAGEEDQQNQMGSGSTNPATTSNTSLSGNETEENKYSGLRIHHFESNKKKFKSLKDRNKD